MVTIMQGFQLPISIQIQTKVKDTLMKIIFHRYGSICEPDLIQAFSSLDIAVIEEDTEITQKNIDPSRRISLIGEAILTHQPAFVFSINFFPHISMVCEKLHVLYVCLSVDCPVLELFSSALRNSCNRIFLFDRKQYEQFYPENPNCIFYLPLGANTDRFDCVISEYSLNANHNAPPPSYLYDLSFIGSLYTEKSRYPALQIPESARGFGDGLISAQLRLPGYNLLEEVLSEGKYTKTFISALKTADDMFPILPDSITNTDAFVAANYFLGMHISSLERIATLNALAEDFHVDLFTRSDTSVLHNVICHRGVSTHKEMPIIFNRSKINLNHTIKPIQSGLSQRIWDVLACGGFLLSDYQSEIPDFLEIGTDLDCYETINELKEKVSFYLAHDEIRQDIARHGYHTVKKNHTYLQRVISMIKIISSTSL